jgi:hypothetical protein
MSSLQRAYFQVELAVWFLLLGIANQARPYVFFFGIAPVWIWGIAILGFGIFGFIGARSIYVSHSQHVQALNLVERTLKDRQSDPHIFDEEKSKIERSISRLSRNMEANLFEIHPDFSLRSIDRLKKVIPAFLNEIQTEFDAKIRIGILGVYIGETLCRNLKLRWKFQSDSQDAVFPFLSSIIGSETDPCDPFQLARIFLMDFKEGRKQVKDYLKLFSKKAI